MRSKGTREISFTLRMDDPDHAALVEWIDNKRGGKQRFRKLRDHIVTAMLAYIADEPHKDPRGAKESVKERREPSNARTASAIAAQSMNF